MKYKIWCRNKNEWEKNPVVLEPRGEMKDRTGYGKFEKTSKEFSDYEKKEKKKKESSYDDDSTIQDMDYEDY